MKAVLTAGVAGVLFALGLGLGGMTDPARVVGFLDVAGAWDPSAAFVMGGALAVHAVARRLILRRQAPLLAPAFPAPGRTRIDGRLLVGAALFGVGWGLSGYCPGPALTALGSGTRAAFLFAASMGAGMALFSLWERVQQGRAAPEAGAEAAPGGAGR